VTLRILDIKGRELQVLGRQMFETGQHGFLFSDLFLPSGIFFLEMSSGDASEAVKFIVK
jgi:hypothetical protein